MHDPIDQFLAGDFTAPGPPALRQSILAQTTRALRRRRLVRRLAQAGALAACFLAGMGTMSLVSPAPMGEKPPEPRIAKAEKKADLAIAPPPVKAEAAPSIVDMEWRAFDSRDNRAALFFDVAQRYFDQSDFESALRCYRQAFDAAPREGLTIHPDDNWLVMALKEARQKEDNNAVDHP